MNFSISIHARERMEQRGISESLIQDILRAPDRVVSEHELAVYQGIIPDATGKQYLYRIFVNDRHISPLVVTVYRTSNIRKYYAP